MAFTSVERRWIEENHAFIHGVQEIFARQGYNYDEATVISFLLARLKL